MVDYACWQVLKYSLGVSRVLSLSLPLSYTCTDRHTRAHTYTRTHAEPNYDLPFRRDAARLSVQTHISESVPGSVLAVLSHGARPFVVAVCGERRLRAQQEESHDR